jgi:hypothetical protein
MIDMARVQPPFLRGQGLDAATPMGCHCTPQVVQNQLPEVAPAGPPGA